MRSLFVVCLVLLSTPALAQTPPRCALGGFVISPDESIWVCRGPSLDPTQVPPGVPAGANILIDSGTCPAGYVENTAWNGKTIVGTIAANKNVGTTGGSDQITPAGTNANGAVSAHTGTAVADHAAHTHTFTQGSNAATPDLVTANTAAAGVAASGTTGNPSAVLTHVVTQPSAHTFTQPAFTGTPFDNRSAFVFAIVCKKS